MPSEKWKKELITYLCFYLGLLFCFSIMAIIGLSMNKVAHG